MFFLSSKFTGLFHISWLITGLPFNSRATAWYLKACGAWAKAKMPIRTKERRSKVFFILKKILWLLNLVKL